MQKLRKSRPKWLLWMLAGLLVAVLIGIGFLVRPVQASNTLRVAGALDLQPAIDAIRGDYVSKYHMYLEFVPSTHALADLQAGKVDAAIIGRDPTNSELVGLQDEVVAQDAVCILIDARTYAGGIQDAYLDGAPNSSGQPAVKYAGLQNLSMEDLRGFYGSVFQVSNSVWTFSGPLSEYFTFQSYLDDSGNLEPDPNNPGRYYGTWVGNAVPLDGEALQPGLFDTEEALLQKLVMPDSVLQNSKISFVSPVYNSEELLISHAFSYDPNPVESESTQAFNYMLEIASRRVTLEAIQHHFSIKALSIDGIDPLSGPSVIYSNTYPLSRRIHLLIRSPWYHPAKQFADYLTSAGAQQLIAASGFLPAIQEIP